MTARKKNSLNRQVRRAYRREALAHILTLPETEFGPAFGMTTTEVPQRAWYGYGKKENSAPNEYYHFKDNGSRVLAVAHLDTVVRPDRRTPYFSTTQQAGPYVRSGALDDRLGAYVILRLLPALGVTCDQLLTTGEESGQSTASFFNPEKDYDWIIEFDRAGTDVVMYQFEDPASRRLVEASGARMGHGSFSDIAYLEQLGAKAFNWGVGYRGNYHSENGYAFLNDTFAMVAKYLRFHTQNAGVTLPHEAEIPEPAWRGAWWDDDKWTPAGPYGTADEKVSTSSPYGNEFIFCNSCSALQAVDPDTLICVYCNRCLNCTEESSGCTCPGGPGVWSVSPAGTATRILSELNPPSADSDIGAEAEAYANAGEQAPS